MKNNNTQLGTKASLRKLFLSKRESLEKADLIALSKTICNSANKLATKSSAKIIGLYLSFGSEVKTDSLIKLLSSKNIKLFVPKFKSGDWVFTRLNKISGLEKNIYGTMQPKYGDEIDINSIDLIFVPGLAFSQNGVRLGYGKGVFDKLLADFNGVKVGLAYDIQITKDIPKKFKDVSVDKIITEKRIIVASI